MGVRLVMSYIVVRDALRSPSHIRLGSVKDKIVASLGKEYKGLPYIATVTRSRSGSYVSITLSTSAFNCGMILAGLLMNNVIGVDDAPYIKVRIPRKFHTDMETTETVFSPESSPTEKPRRSIQR